MAMATRAMAGSLCSDKLALNPQMMGLSFLATFDRLAVLNDGVLTTDFWSGLNGLQDDRRATWQARWSG